MSTVNNEGNLIFDFVEENGQRAYVAEFKATGPFSLHIERRESGRITVYQKSYENGKYATVKNVDIAPQDTIIDAEVPGGVFPKWIKIKSSSEVEVAEVTFEDEQSGGGAGESTMEYLDVSGGGMAAQVSMLFAYLWKGPVLEKMGIFPAVLLHSTNKDALDSISQIAIDFSTKVNKSAGGTEIMSTKDAIMSLYSITEEELAAIPRITKEQFYSLEA